MRRLPRLALLAVLLAGCGAGHRRDARAQLAPAARADCCPATPPPRVAAKRGRPRASQPRPEALVTDENQNLLAVVDVRSAAARLFIGVSGGPEYVAAEWGFAVVTSPSAGAVTLLEGRPLRVAKVLHGFGAPHIVEIAADGNHAYVTDDARGTLAVIRLSDHRVTTTIHVGAQPHHMASSPDQRRLWIALGESARTIATLDTSDAGHPRVIGRFDPGLPAHDLAFSPDGHRVWVTAASGGDVSVFRANDRRLLFRVPVGPPPQHIAFAGGNAYLTSGYGSTIEEVSAQTGKVIRRVRSPYGSFEVDAARGVVATASLLNGRLALYTTRLKLLRVLRIGPATRDIALTGR